MTSTCNTDTKRDSRFRSGQFNPYEIAFSGHSGLGKTTLICKLIQLLKKNYKTSYVKHDAHKFEMDQRGKDTFNAYQAGAHSTFINDPQHQALITNQPNDKYQDHPQLRESDLVIIEGYKNSDIPKFLFLDEKTNLGDFTNVIACIKDTESSLPFKTDLPIFHRNQIVEIKEFLLHYLKNDIQERPLKGLILGGGLSTRMGTDKASLKYNDQNQVSTIKNLLEPLCDEIFLSKRAEQDINDIKDVSIIDDTFLNLGPMGGILSALKTRANNPWLVVACDLPFLNSKTLEHLVKNRNPFKNATAFKSDHNDFPEPLCAIYEPKIVLRMLNLLGLGYHCPRKVLINSEINLINQIDKKALINVNSQEEFKEALKILKK